MNGDWLMFSSNALVERLLLASVDALLLGALVWCLLQLFRRCPPRLAALLWLIVLAKPLLTLVAGPAASLLAIPLPWEMSNAATLTADNSAIEPRFAEFQEPEIDLYPTVAPVEFAPSPEQDRGNGGATERALFEEPANVPDLGSSSLGVTEDGNAFVPSPPVEPLRQLPTSTEREVSNEASTSSQATRPIAERMVHFSKAWGYTSIALLWMASVTWSIVAASVRYAALRRRIAACSTPGNELAEIYASVLTETDYRGRSARLVVGDCFSSPALIGCWQPVVVLPKWFAEQEDVSQLRWALRHEVCHLQHADHWADLVRRMARTLLFFHPVVHLAARRWEEMAEAACDRALVQEEADVVDYTACLVSIVERVGSEKAKTMPLGLFATQTQIQRRIARLLALQSDDFTSLARRYRWILMPAGLMLLCGFSLAQQPQDETTAKEPAEMQAASGPSKSEVAASTSELLAEILEANRYWFEGPPKRVPAYQYTLVLGDGKRQEFSVDDPQTAEVRVKRGVTYMPLVGQVLKALVDASSKAATVEAVERSDGEIRIRFQTDGSLAPRLGGGVLGSWNSYLPFRLGTGTIRLDAASLMPAELTSVWHDERHKSETLVTEKLSEPYEVDGGHWVPLRVEADIRRNTIKDGQRRSAGHDRFDWAFQVYEPGLWLFDAQLMAEETAIGYHLEDVVIGDDEKPTPEATSVAVATIRESGEDTRNVVDQYVEANRAWLLPDLAKRKGLVYDYAQEDGYRERITFDHQGNILAQLASDRQSHESSSAGQQRLYTVDGREVFGTVDQPFVTIRTFDPASTSPFSGRKILNNMALGWGWECASMRLARSPDDFGISIDTPADPKYWILRLQPLHNRPSLHIGTMLCFTSWAYLPSHPFRVCKVKIDRETRLPVKEVYYRKGEDEPFCTIQFEDWLDTKEGKAPGKVIGRATYPKRGLRDPETHVRVEEVFDFTGTYRVTGAGYLLLHEVTSRFKSSDNGSTGRVTVVESTDDDYRTLEDILQRMDGTSEFLAASEKAPHGRSKMVPCRWGEAVPAWLNGKYDHRATGQGDENREPPYIPYRSNLGIKDLRPEVLDDGKIRVAVKVYSTIYYQGYTFDLTLGLLDGDGNRVAEKTVSEKTKTMNRPEQKQVVFEFDGDVASEAIASISVSLEIRSRWGSHHFRDMWMTHGVSTRDRGIPYLPHARDWGAEQAIGEPTNPRIGGDYKHAWSSLTEDGQEEWLELTYRNRIMAVGIDVHETLNPGAVFRVTYYDESGVEKVAWEGEDPVDAKSAWGVSKIRFDTKVETNRVRIYLDSPRVKGWNEIDAVGLVEASAEESSEHVHWAIDATASSTFAEGPRPISVSYHYEGPHVELKYDDGLSDGKQSLSGEARQVVQFTRPKDKPYLDAIRVLGTSDGYRPKKMSFYLLDEDMNILSEQSSGLRIRERGPVKWYTFHAPSVEVPETFFVAFQFNNPGNRGTFVATRRLKEGESSHSFVRDARQELKPLESGGVGYDWMIRAYMSATPKEETRKDGEVRRQPFTR